MIDGILDELSEKFLYMRKRIAAALLLPAIALRADHDRIIDPEQLPAAAKLFIRQYFPGSSVVKIDKERYGYDIEISNDLELKFDRKGRLLEMDD